MTKIRFVGDEIYYPREDGTYSRLVDKGVDDASFMGKYRLDEVMVRVDDIEPDNPLYDQLADLL